VPRRCAPTRGQGKVKVYGALRCWVYVPEEESGYCEALRRWPENGRRISLVCNRTKKPVLMTGQAVADHGQNLAGEMN